MSRAFGPKHRPVILRFAGKKEQENLFVIGTFHREKDPFAVAEFAGEYRGEQMIGLGAYFKRFGSLVINADNNRAIADLVDHFVERRCRIEWMPMFERYALPAIARLRRYGIVPKLVREETVFLLTKRNFTDHPGPVTKATPKDVDDILRLEKLMDGNEEEITDRERAQIFPDGEYLLKIGGKIVARANLQGWSEQYAQIGAVMTHPDHRGQGYGKQVVSAICREWIAKGKHIILFCKNDNTAALAVYEKLGFRPIDRFILAQF